MSNSAPEPQRPIVSTSVHLDPAEVQQLDQLAVRWRVSRSGAVRKLLKAAAAKPDVVAAIEEFSFVGLTSLPKAHRYKFLSDFRVLIGIDNLSFTRGQVISRDGMLPELIEQLFQRGALLEPLD